MDVEAPRNASDVPDNPEVSWWCKILTRVVASIAGVGELSYTLSHNQLIIGLSDWLHFRIGTTEKTGQNTINIFRLLL